MAADPYLAIEGMLTSESNYQSSEGFDARLGGWIASALRQHAPDHTFATLPEQEYQLVMLLAWISLCYARAAKYANQPNTSGAAGYGTDRDSPYRKNMDMARSLEERYKRIVSNLGDSGPGEGITQGNIVVKSTQRDAIVGPVQPGVRVTASYSDVTPTTAVFRWNFPSTEYVADVYVYRQDTPGIFADWNPNTDDGVPYHSNAAEKIAVIQNGTRSAVKVTEMVPGSENYFVAVVKMFSGHVYYSNEVMVLTPNA